MKVLDIIQFLIESKNLIEQTTLLKALAQCSIQQKSQEKLCNNNNWFDSVRPYLSSSNIECKRSAMLALVSISSAKLVHTNMYKQGVFQVCSQAFQSETDENFRLTCLNLFGNLSSSECFLNFFIEGDILDELVHLISIEDENQDIVESLLFIFCNLCGASNKMRKHLMTTVLPERAIEMLSESVEKTNLLMVALAFIRSLSQDDHARHKLPKFGVLQQLKFALSQHKDEIDVCEIIYSTFANFSYYIPNIEFFINESQGLFDYLEYALATDSAEIHSYACCIIANICETQHGKSAVCLRNDGVMLKAVAKHVHSGSIPVKSHVARCLANLCTSPRYHAAVAREDVVGALVELAQVEAVATFSRVNALIVVAALAATHSNILTDELIPKLVCFNLYLYCYLLRTYTHTQVAILMCVDTCVSTYV
eukprot:GHVR01151551.1.p1 GENE.GHVR01151551.1~~GHVR01151551.1.p1  ORF type:complete len:424 (-),score=43.62 GHVR01151551.1:787-2058(-)